MKYFIFYLIFLVIYGLMNYYPALRGYQALDVSYPLFARAWVAVVITGAVLLPLSRVLSNRLPHGLNHVLVITADYWLGIIYYLLLIILAADLIRLADRYFDLLPAALKVPQPIIALAIVVLISVLVVYGTWNARHPVLTHYQLTLEKKSSNLDKLNVVMVSDIHLGWVFGSNRLNQLVDNINALKPDLILLTGDIVDEGIDLSAEAGIPQAFSRLHSRYGTYAIPGNHEYISRQVYQVGKYLDSAGVTVLRDKWVKLDNNLYLVGRDDLTSGRFTQVNRKEISQLMHGVETDKLPVLMMDHQPFNLDQPTQAGIDLQFSGHTHLGQLFPNNLITRFIYEQDWGYLRRENFQLIVSCGYGTWGPPFRIGNRPEIVQASIKFE